jgi:CheY-like chemotaxis protein
MEKKRSFCGWSCIKRPTRGTATGFGRLTTSPSVIQVSALGSDVIEDATKEGFLDYLTKPVDLRAAQDTVEAVLKTR